MPSIHRGRKPISVETVSSAEGKSYLPFAVTVQKLRPRNLPTPAMGTLKIGTKSRTLGCGFQIATIWRLQKAMPSGTISLRGKATRVCSES